MQVGETERTVAALEDKSMIYALPIVNQPSNTEYADDAWWNAFDPAALPSCSKCSFLPICWGGCPKKHLEKDQHALDEQGKYWRMNLPKQIAKRFGETGIEMEYLEEDQFRKGW